MAEGEDIFAGFDTDHIVSESEFEKMVQSGDFGDDEDEEGGGRRGKPPKPKPKPPPPKPKPPPPNPHPGPPPPPVDPFLEILKKLEGPKRDAYAALSLLFKNYGLETLSPKILDFLQQGFSADTITVLLQQTQEYKTRFAGNEARKANGLAVLTPAEYLSTEAAYKQLIRASGLSPSFVSADNMATWIGMDVSPVELQERVNLAVQATTQAPQHLREAFTQLGFAAGDLASYFLNGRKPTPEIQMKMNQAQVMAAGLMQNLQVNPTKALLFAQEGVTAQQAQQAYQKVAWALPRAQQLTSIYAKGSDQSSAKNAGVDQAVLESEFVEGNAASMQRRENLGRMEVAQFSGQGGIGKQTFTQQTAGAPGF